MKVAERFFCPEEYLALQKEKMKKADCYFTELWTRKESYIKAVGKGMALDLASFCVPQTFQPDHIRLCLNVAILIQRIRELRNSSKCSNGFGS